MVSSVLIDDETQQKSAHFTEHAARSNNAQIISLPPSYSRKLTSFPVAAVGAEIILLHDDARAIAGQGNMMEKHEDPQRFLSLFQKLSRR